MWHFSVHEVIYYEKSFSMFFNLNHCEQMKNAAEKGGFGSVFIVYCGPGHKFKINKTII